MNKFLAGFKLHRDGNCQILGELGRKIMNILWTSGECSGRQLWEKMRKTDSLAHTTVLTVIDRLVKRGIVIKEKKENIFFYRPTMDREEFNKTISRDVIRSLYEFSSDSVIAGFIDILSDMPRDKIKKIESLLKNRKR